MLSFQNFHHGLQEAIQKSEFSKIEKSTDLRIGVEFEFYPNFSEEVEKEAEEAKKEAREKRTASTFSSDEEILSKVKTKAFQSTLPKFIQDHSNIIHLGKYHSGKNKIKQFRIIANPGCYPTSIQLPLIPLLKKKLIKSYNITIDSKSGYSGAGKNYKKKFKEALREMNKKKLGTVVITKKQFIKGLLTDGDLRRGIKNFSNNQNLLEIMTQRPLVVNENMPASKALGLMNEKKITSLLVVSDKDYKKNNKKLKGIIHIHSLLENGIK